jgi:hypothetical protein
MKWPTQRPLVLQAHKKEIDFDVNLLAVVPFDLRNNDKEEFRRVVKFRKQHNFIRCLGMAPVTQHMT